MPSLERLGHGVGANGRVYLSHWENFPHLVCSSLCYHRLKSSSFEDAKRGTFTSSVSSNVRWVVLTQQLLITRAPLPVCSVCLGPPLLWWGAGCWGMFQEDLNWACLSHTWAGSVLKRSTTRHQYVLENVMFYIMLNEDIIYTSFRNWLCFLMFLWKIA